jgi:hypothetical protein
MLSIREAGVGQNPSPSRWTRQSKSLDKAALDKAALGKAALDKAKCS